MANTINIPKTHLIMGLSMPLAVLIGYFLAEPMELGSIAVVFAVVGVLCVPLMMRWYHPLLVFCWNAAIIPAFLPGQPAAWCILAFVGVFFGVLNRTVNRQAQFIVVPSLTRSLLLLAAVVVATAMMTGGTGARLLGSSQFGARKYFYLLAAIAGYFALTSRRIPAHRAGLYLACFFLSGITAAIPNLAAAAGPQFSFLYTIFYPGWAIEQLARTGIESDGMVRLAGVGVFAAAIYGYLFARFGIRGVFDLNRPWRLVMFLVPVAAGLLGGFRSYVLQFALTFIALFFVEGLHRTRFLPIMLSLVLLGGVVVLPQAHKLPLVMQRALCFLPGNFDAVAVQNATVSTGWRLEMWKRVLPEVPQYLFKGKGFAIDPTDLFMAQQADPRFSQGSGGAVVAGDYHNGPLSILLPFGIYGMIAFLWLVIAGCRVLYRYYRYGNPDYRKVNAFLFAAFAARAFFFFFCFGSISSDLALFTGLLGFGVALNGAEVPLPAQAEQPAAGIELNTEYIRA
jgi:hypothetical protein